MSTKDWERLPEEKLRGNRIMHNFYQDDPTDQAYIQEQEAYHEAGHAVVMVHLGRAFRQVSIERLSEASGHRLRGVEWVGGIYDGVDLSNIRRAWRSKINTLAICFAGEAGQVLALNRHVLDLSGLDEKQAAEIAGIFFPSEKALADVLREARQQARKLLWGNRKNTEAVCQLAAALLKEQTISYEDARRIIRRARRAVKEVREP